MQRINTELNKTKKKNLFLVSACIVLFALFRIMETAITACNIYSVGLQQSVRFWEFALVFIIRSVIPTMLFMLSVFAYDKCDKMLFSISCGYISLLFLGNVISKVTTFSYDFLYIDFQVVAFYFFNFGFDIIRIICYALVTVIGLFSNRKWELKIVSVSVMVLFDFIRIAIDAKSQLTYYLCQDMAAFRVSMQNLVYDISFLLLSISVLLFILLIEKSRGRSIKTKV